MTRRLFLAVIAVLGAAACGGGGDGQGTPLDFTGGAVESLPQVEQADAGSGAALDGDLLPPPVTSGTVADYLQLRNFFKKECHMYPQDDFCPPGVDAAANDGINEYRFTATTLLGLIYAAEMYGGGHLSRCALTSGTVTASSFVAGTPPGDPDKFLLDTYALYECKGSVGNSTIGRSYQAYSVDPAYQATLTTRYRAPSGGAYTQTDIFQVYVTVTDGVPTALAFNFAAVSSMFGRAVLLVNLVNHRFAVKYQTAGPMLTHVNAIGVGGVNRDSGAENPGHYFVRFTDNMGADATACVNNVGQLIEGGESPCTAEEVPVAWDGAAAVASYLGLTADEQSRLAPFLALLDDSEPIGPDGVPGSQSDADTLFPKTIK
jgi:hypothetical protein